MSKKQAFALGVAGILALLTCETPAHATYLGECAYALKTDTVAFQNNYAAQVSYLETISEEDYKKQDVKANVSVIIKDLPIGASFSQFNEARRSFAKKVGLNFSQEQYEGFLSYTLSGVGAKAFSDCAQAVFGKEGVHLEVVNMTKDAAAVRIHWSPPTGFKDVLKITVTALGGSLVKPLPETWDAKADNTVTIKRDTDHELFITANATSNKGAALSSDTALIPRYVNKIKTTTTSTRYSGQRSNGYCGGNRDGRNKAGNVVQVVAMSDDETLVFQSANWRDIKVGSEMPPPEDQNSFKWVATNASRVAGYVVCRPPSADATSSISAVIEVPVKTIAYIEGP